MVNNIIINLAIIAPLINTDTSPILIVSNLVVDNIISNRITKAKSGFGLSNTIRYNIIYNQIAHDQDGAGIGVDQWCDNSQVYYNVIYHTDAAGIYVLDASHTRVYNNTIYDSWRNSSGTGIITGSISLTAGGVSTAVDTIVKNNNVYAIEPGDRSIFVDANYITN